MITDIDMRQRLNLVRTSRSFVLREIGDLGEADVLSVTIVPKGNGVFWVPGTTILKCGQRIESVFRVDTDTGGSLLSVYWWLNGGWYEHSDKQSLIVLGLSNDAAFPFDWTFAIALEEDIFHSS